MLWSYTLLPTLFVSSNLCSPPPTRLNPLKAMEFFRPAKSTPVLEAVHSLVRTRVDAWDADRFMNPDIEAVLDLIRSGELWRVASSFLDDTQEARL